MLIDTFGRRIDYLRLSVTDRCNLRCVYCLPEAYSNAGAAAGMLSTPELVRLVSFFVAQGISKLRITGGEPLVRPGLAELVRGLAGLRGVADLALSTNGVLLAGLAAELALAGLRRVNVSLDSLRPERFRAITRFGRLEQVLTGIEAALSAGLAPVKLNVVVARGLNEDEIPDFARLTEAARLHVRFIELMPMGDTGFFSKERWLPAGEIMERAGPLLPLLDADRPAGHGPARYFRRPRAKGTIGIISALSRGFCASCNRMRLTAQGVLMPCLDSDLGADFGTALRNGAGSEELARLLAEVLSRKPQGHSMPARAALSSANPRFMCQTGG